MRLKTVIDGAEGIKEEFRLLECIEKAKLSLAVSDAKSFRNTIKPSPNMYLQHALHEICLVHCADVVLALALGRRTLLTTETLARGK